MTSRTPKYQTIARQLGDKLRLGQLDDDVKLPSVRTLSRELRVSINTVQQAYYCLEAEGLVEARPQSGYYARSHTRRQNALPHRSQPTAHTQQPDLPAKDSLLLRLIALQNQPDWLPFSMNVPSPSLIPIQKLNKALQQALRTMPNAGIGYDAIPGNLALRQQIARYTMFWGGNLTADELITTEGCTAALTLCLKAVTKPGDTIAVESPAYFGILQTVLSLGLQVLELPTDPLTGIDLPTLDDHLKAGRVQACLFVTNFSNPLGSCMTDTGKQQLVRLLETYQVPLIEDDLYGDLHYAPHRPVPCKAYDRQGLVLWCGSFSKTLAPGYRVGWVAPGRYYDALLQLKRFQAGVSPGITQQAIAHFLANDRYELHLHRLRQTLKSNCLRYQQTIRASFPASTRISEPQGSFSLWLELHPAIDTVALCEDLLTQNISIMPGNLFSLQPQYANCLRLSYGMPYDQRVEAGLRQIGQLVSQYSAGQR